MAPYAHALHRRCSQALDALPSAVRSALLTALLPVLLSGLLVLGWGGQPAAAALLHLEGPIPTDLGVRQGQLAPCPTPAHCSSATWPVADPAAALEALLPTVLGLDGIEVVETGAGYLHATATSRLFGFVDDLELYADHDHGVLQARSLSRLGDSDLGVNARRLEVLHAALMAQQPAGR